MGGLLFCYFSWKNGLSGQIRWKSKDFSNSDNRPITNYILKLSVIKFKLTDTG